MGSGCVGLMFRNYHQHCILNFRMVPFVSRFFCLVSLAVRVSSFGSVGSLSFLLRLRAGAVSFLSGPCLVLFAFFLCFLCCCSRVLMTRTGPSAFGWVAS